MRSVFTSIFLYARELCTLTTELQRRIQATEMRCHHKILRISYKDHVTNGEVRAETQQAIAPHEDLLTMVKRRKLQWYGHVSRSSGLAKTILQTTVKGGRRQDRQRKRWEDNIREWTGLEFAKSQRAVENRENGGNWLQYHLWCPNHLRSSGIDLLGVSCDVERDCLQADGGETAGDWAHPTDSVHDFLVSKMKKTLCPSSVVVSPKGLPSHFTESKNVPSVPVHLMC